MVWYYLYFYESISIKVRFCPAGLAAFFSYRSKWPHSGCNSRDGGGGRLLFWGKCTGVVMDTALHRAGNRARNGKHGHRNPGQPVASRTSSRYKNREGCSCGSGALGGGYQCNDRSGHFSSQSLEPGRVSPIAALIPSNKSILMPWLFSVGV